MTFSYQVGSNHQYGTFNGTSRTTNFSNDGPDTITAVGRMPFGYVFAYQTANRLRARLGSNTSEVGVTNPKGLYVTPEGDGMLVHGTRLVSRINVGSGPAVSLSGTVELNNLTEAYDIAIGHELEYVVGKNGGVGVVSRLDHGARMTRGRFGEGYLIDPIAISVHPAPEPGTMAALAVGGAILLMRRRKKPSA